MRLTHILTGLTLAALTAAAQYLSPGAISFTATADNVAVKNSVKIDLARWSTDEELGQLVAAWKKGIANQAKAATLKGQDESLDRAAALAALGQGRVDAGTTGTARVKPQDQAAVAARAAAAAAEKARLAREAIIRGTPENLVVDSMQKIPIIGYLWSSGEVSGYNVHYAARFPEPDGGARIILITEKRLGQFNRMWKPAGAAAVPEYGFSVIEFHVDARGEGEGKASLTGKVILDNAGKILTLENYGAAPVIFRGVKFRAEQG